MTYIKIEGKYMTLKEIAEKYDMPIKLIQFRASKGITDINELTQPKYEMLRK